MCGSFTLLGQICSESSPSCTHKKCCVLVSHKCVTSFIYVGNPLFKKVQYIPKWLPKHGIFAFQWNDKKWFLGDHLWTIPHSSMGMKSTYILKPNTKAQNGMCWPLPINIKNNAQANVRGQIETLNSQMTINITSFINFQRWSHSLSNVIKRAINWIEMWKMIFENSCFGYKCGGHFPIFIFPNDDEGKFWSSHKWYWSLVNNFSNVSKTINPNIVDYKKEPTLDVTIKNQWTCVTKKNTMST